MSTYQFEQVQFIPRPRSEVFAFFADAANLERITPGFLHFRIVSRMPIEMKPGALVDGPTLFEADLGYEIDNMEGISVHKSGGETVITLVSDDNFSFFQRTLLLQFTLAEP